MASLALQSYHIHVGDIRENLKHFLQTQAYSRVFVVVDENTRTHCWSRLDLTDAHLIEVPAGERHKNLETCRHIWETMLEAGADRRGLVINLGGGVIGDMGGFCACTFKRGMDFVQVPTTLLSQVDASIGGKLGIDFGGVKNSVGLFADPQAVFIDPVFLETLPARELRSGFAEVIKHALIADAAQWQWLRAAPTDLATFNWVDVLLPSLRIKQRIVASDPYERGLRKALNFGHTVGHAVEGHALRSGPSLLHGEAVAVGMVAEAWLSHRRLALPAADLDAITTFLLERYGGVRLDKENDNAYLELMRNDKKNEGGKILFSLLRRPGEAAINQACTEKEIIGSLNYYRTAVRNSN